MSFFKDLKDFQSLSNLFSQWQESSCPCLRCLSQSFHCPWFSQSANGSAQGPRHPTQIPAHHDLEKQFLTESFLNVYNIFTDMLFKRPNDCAYNFQCFSWRYRDLIQRAFSVENNCGYFEPPLLRRLVSLWRAVQIPEEITWLVSTNQSTVYRSRDHYWPITGQYYLKRAAGGVAARMDMHAILSCL